MIWWRPGEQARRFRRWADGLRIAAGLRRQWPQDPEMLALASAMESQR